MKRPSTYLRMRILGAIDYAQGKNIKKRIEAVSENTFTDEDGNQRKFTWRTISTWYYRYKAYGVTSIKTRKRADTGTHRKMTPEELLEAINQIAPYFRERQYNMMNIYRKGIEKGIIKKEHLAQTTFYRFVKEYDLFKDDSIHKNKKRLAFAMQYANQLWQGDTLYGPFVRNKKDFTIQTRLIAFIDDASRVLCHGEFFFSENTDALIKTFKSAFYKRGVPEQLYVDNGSIYSSQEITLICARVGCILRHAPLRDGAAKGKIERFFRTVRIKFLSRQLDLSSIGKLNEQFTKWVEEEYNAVVHTGIGMKPIDRFGMDLKRINFLPPSHVNDELFYAENTRKVKKDNTFSFNGIRFEAPADLRDKSICIRFDRTKEVTPVIVYYKNQRLGEAKRLDLIANGLMRRQNNNGKEKLS